MWLNDDSRLILNRPYINLSHYNWMDVDAADAECAFARQTGTKTNRNKS